MDIGRLLRNAKLPSPAPVVLKLFEVLESGGGDDLARVIEADPGLTARILRLANSAFYVPTQVASVRDAIVRVGTAEVAALALASEVMRTFRGIPEERFSVQSFWEHSLWVASYSQALRAPAGKGQSVPLWLCGLLHDIGRLLLARQLPVEYAAVLERVETVEAMLDAERDVLGFTHAQLGAELLTLWRLPAVLVEVAARHHDHYERIDDAQTIVAAANDLANEQGEGEGLPGMTAEKTQEVKAAARELYTGYRQLFSEV